MPERDYYRILGVTPDSDPEVIEAAYRALMRKHHPDVRSSNAAGLNRAREINEAYEVLGDPRKREEYNRTRNEPSKLPSVGHPDSRSHDQSRTATPVSRTPTGLKRCIDCAEEIQPLARVCRYCGARQDGFGAREGQTTNVHTHVYATPPPPPPPPEPLQIEAPRKRSGTGLVLTIVGVLLFIWFLSSLGGTETNIGNDALNSTTVSDNSALDMNATEMNATEAPQDAAPIPEPPADQSATEDSNTLPLSDQPSGTELPEQDVNGM